MLVYVRNAADGRILERVVVELLNRSGKIGSRLVLDESASIRNTLTDEGYHLLTLCLRWGRGLY